MNKLSFYDPYCVVKAQLWTEPSSPLSQQTAETSLLKKQENTTRNESKVVKTKQRLPVKINKAKLNELSSVIKTFH